MKKLNPALTYTLFILSACFASLSGKGLSGATYVHTKGFNPIFAVNASFRAYMIKKAASAIDSSVKVIQLYRINFHVKISNTEMGISTEKQLNTSVLLVRFIEIRHWMEYQYSILNPPPFLIN